MLRAIVIFVVIARGHSAQRPLCQLAEALVGSVDAHLGDWDNQIEIGLNDSLNCSMFLEFVYLSRDRIRSELEFVRGNFTEQEESLKAQGEDGTSTTWAMSHMSLAASLVSAHVHIHGVLAAARPSCLSENLQLLFLMSLRRMKTLLQSQLRQLWVVFQGTSELFRQGAGRWLAEMVELFEADLRTMESIMVTWVDPDEPKNETTTTEADGGETGTSDAPLARPGPPLPPFSPRQPDGVALSTLEVLRRDTFEEWNLRKPLLRELLRHVLPRDGHVADICAGSGKGAEFLNDTGLLSVYAFDASANIRQLSKGAVELLRIHMETVSLWRTFDMTLCLTAVSHFGHTEPEVLAQVWQNIDALSSMGAIISCGTGESRQRMLGAAEAHAPDLKLDEALTRRLWDTADGQDAVCVFWRAPQA